MTLSRTEERFLVFVKIVTTQQSPVYQYTTLRLSHLHYFYLRHPDVYSKLN